MTGSAAQGGIDVLGAERLSIAYGDPNAGGKLVISDASFVVESGEVVAVTGPSGSGKSSLVDTLALVKRAAGGDVIIKGRATSSLSERQRSAIRREYIGYVFQSFNLIAHLSAWENVALGCSPGEERPAARARDLLASFDISEDHWGRIPSRLSVGQRQRVSLARALAKTPALILADEPTGNLDPDNTAVVIDSLRTYASRGGAVLIVTHDQQVAAAADRILTASQSVHMPGTMELVRK